MRDSVSKSTGAQERSESLALDRDEVKTGTGGSIDSAEVDFMAERRP